MPLTEDEKYTRAKKRVVELKGFYSHFGLFALISLFLFLVDMFTSPGKWWFFWPVLGWGMLVGIQALKVFALGKGWESRKMRELMGEDQ